MAPIIRRGYDLNMSVQFGRGRNAKVYECHAENGQRYALKLYSDEGSRTKRDIAREKKILRHLRGHPNIVQLIDSVRAVGGGPDRGIVLEYIEHRNFRELFPQFGPADVCFYMGELAGALEFAHACGVMHRDVRPQNVVINHDTRQLRLVGWGSSEFYRPGAEYTPCTGAFKPPELLLGVEKSDAQVDMWSFGTMLASMIFRKEPFFYGTSRADQLLRIAQLLGTDRLYTYCLDNEIDLDEDDHQTLGYQRGQSLVSYITSENRYMVSDEALDVIRRLLQWDPKDRLTSAEVLEHEYFLSPIGEEEEEWQPHIGD